jgi:HKD family nuclease
MYQQLQPQLKKVLPEAKNVYIATALIKNYGYQFIEQWLPDTAKRYYLIGLNLPSDAAVFEQMLHVPATRGHTRIFADAQTFHPKVYLIERRSGQWIAFIGSANTTNGGLTGNVEMSVATEDQEACIALRKWFTHLSENAGELTPEFITAWKRSTSRIRQRQSANAADLVDALSLLKKTVTVNHTPTPGIGQFFRAEDYEAFTEKYWKDPSAPADALRRKVWFRLAELDRRIYAQFAPYGLGELATHYWKQNRISHYQHRQGFNNPNLKSIWLHYGYPNRSAQKDFTAHPRMQVILHHNDVGIWLVVGTENSSVTERRRFKENLLQQPSFADLVYRVATDLGGAYWLGINGKRPVQLSQFETTEKLTEALLSEETQHYLIIGRTYAPDDPGLSDALIAETVLLEFQRLYPLYLLYKNGRL